MEIAATGCLVTTAVGPEDSAWCGDLQPQVWAARGRQARSREQRERLQHLITPGRKRLVDFVAQLTQQARSRSANTGHAF